MLRQLIRYFNPPDKLIAPAELITEYDVTDATYDEALLMRLRLARSPQHARRLLDETHSAHAIDYLPHVRPRRRLTFGQRVQRLIWHWEGHNPIQWHKTIDERWRSKIKTHYRYDLTDLVDEVKRK